MDDTAEQITIETHASLADIPASEWDACACPEASNGTRPIDPFTTHRFLLALEASGSVGGRSGWQPTYLTARAGGTLIACAPMYGKYHSQGEYVFDHGWANAFEQAGGDYYPKLQIAVPFTPVPGRRFLVKPGYEHIGMPALVQGALQVAERAGLSGVHATFCTTAEASTGEKLGLLHRRGQQFHWQNDGYNSFDDFLAALSSRKRKMIRKERRQAQGFGGDILHLTGDQIEPAHWEAFWRFYQDTGARKWGTPYLTRAFFEQAQATLRDDILLVLARREGAWVAGAMNFIGAEALYGRYWGCTEHHPCLHFELCYYAAIDEAIARGLARVEAGAQGEHKLARGYLPRETHSLHWLANKGFHRAVEDYLLEETRAVDEEIDILTSYGPFKRGPDPEEQD